MKINQPTVAIDMTDEERKTLVYFFNYLSFERNYSPVEVCDAFYELLDGNVYDGIKINIVDS